MSKMSELSQVLDEMIACGEGMIKAANAIKDIFSSTEEAPAKTEPKTNKGGPILWQRFRTLQR